MLRFSDIVGVDVMRGKEAECPSAYLNVYAYPRQKRFGSSAQLRRRRCLTFIFSHFESFEENHADALQWQLVMSYLIRRIDVKQEGKKVAVGRVKFWEDLGTSLLSCSMQYWGICLIICSFRMQRVSESLLFHIFNS